MNCYIGEKTKQFRSEICVIIDLQLKKPAEGGVPSLAQSVGAEAFAYTGIYSYHIQEEILRAGAFRYCYGLNSISLDGNLKEIEEQAFYGCENLESINFIGTMEQWNKVKKGAGWDYGVKEYRVYCSDGVPDSQGNKVEVG